MRKFMGITAAAIVIASAAPAGAETVVVNAQGNSSSGGAGAAAIALTAGQNFTVSVDPNDLWSAGALPRWSNADGLSHDLFATGTDDSHEAAGTQIGQDFGIWSQNGLDAPYGTLVGEIGGVFKVLGTSFNGAAWGTGTLNLYYWDSNNGDNSEFITASVSAIPEPAAWGLLIAGFAFVGSLLRRRAAGRVVTA